MGIELSSVQEAGCGSDSVSQAGRQACRSGTRGSPACRGSTGSAKAVVAAAESARRKPGIAEARRAAAIESPGRKCGCTEAGRITSVEQARGRCSNFKTGRFAAAEKRPESGRCLTAAGGSPESGDAEGNPGFSRTISGPCTSSGSNRTRWKEAVAAFGWQDTYGTKEIAREYSAKEER